MQIESAKHAILPLIHNVMKWKNPFLMLLIVIITISNIYACDQCGCSIAGSYNNITGYAHNNYFMLKSSYYQFSKVTADNPSQSTMFELGFFAGYNITNRLHLLAFIPYKYNVFNGSAEPALFKTKGFGDATLLSNYTIFTNKNDVMAKFTHTLSIKAGIELPTGNFIDDYRVLKVPAMVSTGSGSIDWHTGLRYIYKRKNTTLIGDYAYKLNTINKSEYQFGNQQSLSLIAAQRFMHANNVFTPYVGFTAEQDGIDNYHKLEQHGTDGETVILNSGFEFGFKNYIAGIAADIPIYSTLEAGTKSSPRLSLRFAYMLKN